MKPENEQLFGSRISFGQGKTATTILTEGGYYYPVIHEPYNLRAADRQPRPWTSSSSPRKGDRPMHRTTLTIAKPPWSPDYTTIHKQDFSGSKTLEPASFQSQCRSMHTSQIQFGTVEVPDRFISDHMSTYRKQDRTVSARPYLKSLENKLNQIEGAKVKDVIKPDKEPQSYWSQYNRIHNKLGLLRGPGVEREYPVRLQYDPITGEEKGQAWKPNNLRVSGNRVLYGMRRQLSAMPFLF
ncbi:unnamed protein product [Candidula unifasciata]|uniref:Uncharacterized protein n=1 Tax=Candidula unifasciata TaxID=100452 RepID=A0A8S3YW83_9EUPU|nr:unnamed protein product [Candidula unifasciata]